MGFRICTRAGISLRHGYRIGFRSEQVLGTQDGLPAVILLIGLGN